MHAYLRNAFLLSLVTAAIAFAGDAGLMTLNSDHFRDTAIITDDPVASVTTVSTEKGYVEHHGPLRAVWNDEYLFGIVDRKASRRTLQVVATITYRGSRRNYANARLQVAGTATTVPTVHMKSTSVNCPTGECTYTDQVSFPIEESALRQLVAHAGDKAELWHFTLVEPSGNYTGEFSTAEIAGFLAKVDEYTGAAPPRPAVAQPKPELGVGGLRVEGTPQSPARRGVLVTAVVPGSVADQAGIIVGDIISEFAGRQVAGLGDLQAAMAASSAHAAVAFKVYRGTMQMTLDGHL